MEGVGVSPRFPAPQTHAHLLQYCLLGEVELLEAVVLVITGRMQVVSVDLGTRRWRAVRQGRSKKLQKWRHEPRPEEEPKDSGLGLTRSTVFFLLVSARGPDTNASHRCCCSSGSSEHTDREECEAGECQLPTPTSASCSLSQSPASPFSSCPSCSALGPCSAFCTTALATRVRWPM